MNTFKPLAQFINRDNHYGHGQFTVTAGAVSLVQFKRQATVVRNSAGLFTVSLWSDAPGSQVVPLKNMHLKTVVVTQAKPALSTDGGWTWSVVDPQTLFTSGTFQIQAAQQSWAASDPTGIIRVEYTFSPEAAS